MSRAISRNVLKSCLVGIALVASACGSTGMEVAVTVPEGVPEAAKDVAAEIVGYRLAELVGDSAQLEKTADGLVLELPAGTQEAVVDLVIAQGSVDLRPVLGRPAMRYLQRFVRNAPEPLVLVEAGHFVQEWGEEVATAALRAFAEEESS